MSDIMQTMSHESSGLCWCGPNNHGPEECRYDFYVPHALHYCKLEKGHDGYHECICKHNKG